MKDTNLLILVEYTTTPIDNNRAWLIKEDFIEDSTISSNNSVIFSVGDTENIPLPGGGTDSFFSFSFTSCLFSWGASLINVARSLPLSKDLWYSWFFPSSTIIQKKNKTKSSPIVFAAPKTIYAHLINKRFFEEIMYKKNLVLAENYLLDPKFFDLIFYNSLTQVTGDLNLGELYRLPTLRARFAKTAPVLKPALDDLLIIYADYLNKSRDHKRNFDNLNPRNKRLAYKEYRAKLSTLETTYFLWMSPYYKQLNKHLKNARFNRFSADFKISYKLNKRKN